MYMQPSNIACSKLLYNIQNIPSKFAEFEKVNQQAVLLHK